MYMASKTDNNNDVDEELQELLKQYRAAKNKEKEREKE